MNLPVTVSKRRIPTGNAGSEQTLAEMSRLAYEGSVDPVVIQAAQNVVRNVPEGDHLGVFRAMLGDVRRRMRYTHDPLDAEVVKAPRFVIDHSDRFGVEPMDCDDASTLLAAMLAAVGYRSEFVTVASDGTRPGTWSHVYVVAFLHNGQRVALDPIVRRFGVGEEVPENHLTSPRVYHRGASMGRYHPSMLGADAGTTPAASASEMTWGGAFTEIGKSFRDAGQQYLAYKTEDAKARQAQAAQRTQVRLAKIAAKQQAAAGAPSGGGLFTDAAGKPNWPVIGVVAVVGIGLAYAMTRKS